jgi:tripartite-type tricarboxylate transporter receptor subunit TctC
MTSNTRRGCRLSSGWLTLPRAGLTSRTTPNCAILGSTALRRFCLLAAMLLTCGVAHAQTPEEFYKGRTVNIVIGYSVGGGYDLYARLLARYLGHYIPGNPTVVPQSMPGAGSLKALMYLYSVAPKDGTVFGTFGRTVPLEPIMSGAKFDPRKLSWIGSITNDVSLCVTWQSSPVKTWDDLMTKSVRLGGQASGSDPDAFAAILKNLFGANIKLVTGYPGNNELALAMEREEIDGYCGLSWSSLVSEHPDWMKEHKINILVQAAQEKNPDLPSTPTLLSKTDDPKKKTALKIILTTQELARPYAAPPDVPADRLGVLRQAFAQTMDDPEFLDEAAKLGLDVNPVGGPKIQAMLEDVFSSPPDLLELAKQAEGH